MLDPSKEGIDRMILLSVWVKQIKNREGLCMPEEPKEVSRGAARFSVDLAVECYPSVGSDNASIEAPSKETPREPSFDGEVTNISSSGFCIITTHSLKANEVLKVSFPIQSSISNFISTPRTLVEVRWTKPADKDKYMVGLRFLL
jgi:hypothetical protein